MAKKVIQIPIDEGLLKELDLVSKRKKQARAELIREACRQHLRKIEREEMDRAYGEAYEKTPESPEWGELGGRLLAERYKEESW